MDTDRHKGPRHFQGGAAKRKASKDRFDRELNKRPRITKFLIGQ